MNGKKNDTPEFYPGHNAVRGSDKIPVAVIETDPEGITSANQASHDRQIKPGLALRESEERLKLAVKMGDIGIWDFSLKDKTVHDISSWVSRILGHDFGNPVLSVETCSDLIHPEDLPLIRSRVRDHFSGTAPIIEAEFRVRCRDRSWKWVLLNGIVIERDDSGHPVRITGTVRDNSSSRIYHEFGAEMESSCSFFDSRAAIQKSS